MRITRRDLLALSGAAALSTIARPAAAAELAPGVYPLKLDNIRDGALYIPRGYRSGVPMPLVVLFHGAGGSGLGSVSSFPIADELGFIVLAPDSRDERTWDLLLKGFGPDVEFLQEALRQTLNRCSVDRRHLAVAGVSDGASFSLSFGIGAGDVFSRIIAFSPGVMQPIAAKGKPRIFISHGTSDDVMPIDITSRAFVKRLKALDYDVTYREFDGGHRTPPAISREAYTWLSAP